MSSHVGTEQLVGAESQQVQQHGVDLIDRPTGRSGNDSIKQTTGTARPVGEFGGERRITAGDTAFGEQCGQRQVGVGVTLGDCAQYVERRAPRRVQLLAALTSAAVHDARTPASRRAPRAQSAAAIRFLPGG